MAANWLNKKRWWIMQRDGGEQGPPDLMDAVKKVFGSSGSKSGGEGGNGHIARFVGFALALIVVLWILSGIFIVSPAERSVVLRFGRYLTTVGPGPHWIPRFMDSKYTFDVQQVRNFSIHAEMLTQDENIVSVDLAVQYRVMDLQKYLFSVVDPAKTLQQATSSALRQVVGQMTLDAVLTTGRDALRDQVEQQLKEILAVYQAGMQVVDVTLQPVKPPEAVTAAFDDAIKAREDKQSYINKATAYQQKVMSIASGQVARLVQKATAYEQEVNLQAQGLVARYLALLKPFEKAPRVTRERLYLDAVSNVLLHTHNIVVGNGNNNILYLPLQQLLNQHLQTTPTDLAKIEAQPAAVKLPATEPAGDSYQPVTRPSYDGG
ncbi:MAG: FtsH protease activity modulator HflK [Gammaproteobacteria bacterium]|nr:FtsH protease activity modulator HflK [Gammaproteobacteria bacterium]